MTGEPRRFPDGLYKRGSEPDARFSLANERTFLAWIRTALALIAGGVALDARGLGLQQDFGMPRRSCLFSRASPARFRLGSDG